MTVASRKQRKLLNLSINRGMQLRMIGRISGILFVSLCLSSLIYYYFAHEEITASFRLFHVKARSFLDLLWPMILGSFVISLITGVIAALFVPKYYAGSLYRIETDLAKILDGDLACRIFLRKGDELTRLAGQLNQLTAQLRDELQDIGATLSQAQQLAAPEAPGQPEQRLTEIEQLQRRIREQLDRYQLES